MLRVILRFFALLTFVVGVAGQFASTYWYLDLFNAFLPQVVFGGLVILAAALLLKDHWGIGLVVVAVVLNLTTMGIRLFDFPAADRMGDKVLRTIPPVKVMFANVLRMNQQHQALLDRVRAAKPDIFVAAEVSPAWEDALSVLHPEYPYRVIVSRPDNFGLAVYSTRPFPEENAHIAGDSFPIFTILFDEGFRLVAAHPPPPIGEPLAMMQQDYMREMAKLIAEAKEPLIVVGDMNATLWSHSFAPLKGLGLKRADASMLGWTWPSGFMPLAIRLDYVFVKDVQVADAHAMDDVGSDHFPVWATLHFSRPLGR